MRRYETMMVLHPELPEAQIRETLDRARRLIEGMGAEIHQVDEWGMRQLAYPIRKLGRGYYVVTEYSAEPKVVNEFERTMKLADEVLRYITVAKSDIRRRASASVVRPATERPEPVATEETPAVAAESAESAAGTTGADGPAGETERPEPAATEETPAVAAESAESVAGTAGADGPVGEVAVSVDEQPREETPAAEATTEQRSDGEPGADEAAEGEAAAQPKDE